MGNGSLGIWLYVGFFCLLGFFICILPWRFAGSSNPEERFWILVILYCSITIILCYLIWFVNRWNIVEEAYRLPTTIALVAVPNALGVIAAIAYHLGKNKHEE